MREQTTKKIGMGLLSITAVFSLIFTTTGGAFAATAPSLGTAATYGVLAGTSVTNTGNTVVTGDLGVSPGNTVTGFPPGTVSGTTNAGNAAAATAQNDLTTAYANAAGQACTSTLATDLGGQTLTPGVYCFTGDAALTGTVTFNAQNDPNAVFIVKVVGDLNVANSATVALSNGALAANIYWQVGDSVVVGTGATFRGTMMVLNDITLGSGTSVSGRVLARAGAVTLNNNAITVAPGSTKGTLIVIKNVTNNNGGTSVPSDFTMTVTGVNPSMTTFPGSSTGTTVTVDPGAYHVDEVPEAGYTGSPSSGCNGNIAAGQTVTCTITNDDVGTPPSGKGQLIVTKHVINDNGGTSQASAFTMTVTGTNPSPSSFPGSESGTTVTLDPGGYNVSESAVAGYVGTFSSGCSGTIVAGQTLNCTVTNNDVGVPPSGKGQLIVVKHVVNDNGGTSQASAFTMTVTGTNPTPSSFPGSESGTTVTLDPGAYAVTESTVTGYVGSYSTGCNGTIVAGQTLTCTVTNNDTGTPPTGKGTLIVRKHVINDDGGTSQASAFTMTVSGSSPSPSSFPGSESGTTVTLNPGSYSVSESTVAGYNATYSTECFGAILAGQTLNCTVTNNDFGDPPAGRGQVIVSKSVVNDNGGNKVDSDFTIIVTGGNPSPSSFPGDETGTTVTLNPGGYSIDEQTTSGYSKSLSANCVGSILAGQTKFCTVTNNDIGPTPPPGKATLTVYKTVINDQGGTMNAAQFTITVNGSGVSPQSFPGNVNGTSVTLNPGSYSVTEPNTAGYRSAFGAGCSGTVSAGDIISCVVTNNDISPIPPPAGSCDGFSDVNANDVDCDAFIYVSSIGAMAGNPDGTFAPSELVQRDQAAKISLLAFNRFNGAIDYCNGVNPFPDVRATDWAFQYICRGKQIGMIMGYASGVDAGLYRLARPVNRAEWLALMLRNVNETMPSIFSTSYTDVDSGQWFSGYARYSQMHDLFLGSRLFPAQYATRREVAQTLFQLHNEGKL